MKLLKNSLFIAAFGLALVSLSARADQTGYQSTISSQNPLFRIEFDNSLTAPDIGTGTFTATSGANFAADPWGNLNSAVSFAASSDQLSYATGSSIINGMGTTSTAVGSMSLLFKTPSTLTSSFIIFSAGDLSANTGNFSMNTTTTGGLQFKAFNRTTAMTGTLTASTWYYVAFTWDATVATGGTAAAWNLGAIGGTLSSGTVARGTGTGLIDTTKPFGNITGGSAFVLSGKQIAPVTGGFVGGAVDELATWNTILSTQNINDQFAALAVPEPATFGLLGIGGLLLVGARRIRSLRSH